MDRVRLSATKINTWQSCPRKFYLTYIARVRRPRGWAHFSVGSSVHNALKAWWELPLPDRTPEQGATLVSAHWIPVGFRDHDHSLEWQERSGVMVQNYLETQDPQKEPLSTERSLSFLTDTLIVEGRIDRLDENPGTGITVIDYKTGKDAPTEQEVRSSVALALYALMVQRVLKRDCGTVALHHVPTAQIVEAEISEDNLAQHLARVESVGRDIRRAVDTHEALDHDRDDDLDEVREELFPAQPGPLCGYCDYWEMCESGRAFTERREPWAALERARE